MTRREVAKFVVVRSLGNFLVLFSLYGVVATFGPPLYYELQYRLIEAKGIKFTVQSSPFTVEDNDRVNSTAATISAQQEVKTGGPSFLDVLVGKREQVLIPYDPQFSILIPKIGASAKVYPNIDSTNTTGFLPILQKGIAHAKGTVFPGMLGNIYLFAHSTDNWWNVGQYNAVFYLLKDLSSGDRVVVFFENTRYEYVVKERFLADPSYVTLLSGEQRAKQRLILQTCWPPGTTWKRLFIVAVPKSE